VLPTRRSRSDATGTSVHRDQVTLSNVVDREVDELNSLSCLREPWPTLLQERQTDVDRQERRDDQESVCHREVVAQVPRRCRPGQGRRSKRRVTSPCVRSSGWNSKTIPSPTGRDSALVPGDRFDVDVIEIPIWQMQPDMVTSDRPGVMVTTAATTEGGSCGDRWHRYPRGHLAGQPWPSTRWT
jgi:hypothetical protein